MVNINKDGFKTNHLSKSKDKSLAMNKNLSNIFKSLVVSLLIFIIVYSCFIFICGYIRGKQAVNIMYTFKDSETLATVQMPKLEKICSNQSYKNLTSKNVERALTTYLKFLRNPSKVEILELKHNQVIYRLDCKSIESNRVFMFKYNVNMFGKIINEKEYELVSFYN